MDVPCPVSKCCQSSSHIIFTCPCNVPETLYLSTNDDTKNHGYFPGGTFVWGAPPAALTAICAPGGTPSFPNPGFWDATAYSFSTGTAPCSPIPSTQIYRYLWCAFGAYYYMNYLSVITSGCASSGFCGPNWNYSFSGNSCSPFLMTLTTWSPVGFDTTQTFTLSA